jgi:hypothetical protein
VRPSVGFLVVLASLPVATISAQDSTGVRGIRSPSTLRPTPVTANDFLRLVNSIEVLADSSAGVPRLRVRVISVWGSSAHLDCDCLTSRLDIGLNEDGQTLRAYRLPELLDPKVDSITTEKTDPVIYLSYGLPAALRRARIVATLSGVRVTQASAR